MRAAFVKVDSRVDSRTLMGAQNGDASEIRFSFGQNWTNFLSVVDEGRVAHATGSLAEALGDIRGKSFLDAGCGSGIHSLAAVRLGASRVHSFDYDRQSVECTREMKRRFAADSNWHIERGSVLDETYIRSLGKFDIVYSWGVLHHTGDMWKALDLVGIAADEKLMVAIYNDQGWKSRFWQSYKRSYNRTPRPVQRVMEILVLGWAWGKPFLRYPRRTRERWKNYLTVRGMSPWYDVVDWAGGYPFEVATPAELISFYEKRGFLVGYQEIRGGASCNDFVFSRH
jgi:SAM-dependent methyltransferase